MSSKKGAHLVQATLTDKFVVKKASASNAAKRTLETVDLTEDVEAVGKRQRVDQESWLADLITRDDWKTFLNPLTSSPTFHGIETALDEEYSKANAQIFPPKNLIFSAFNSLPLAGVKVVLIGQDPYHDVNQAHGLCFSVLPGVRVPPSLRNMYKELATDIPGFKEPNHGYLQSWATQGILMLNATLTVRAHTANSHSAIGWQHFTDGVISTLSKSHPSPLVFLLWGNFAKKKKSLIDTKRHLVVECAHPSPLSAKAWFGCKTFSKCNDALEKLGHTPIDWNLPMTAPIV